MCVRNLCLLKMGKYSDYNWLNFRRFIRVVSLKLLYFYVVPIFVFYLTYLSLCLGFAFFFSSALYFYFFPLFFHCFCCFYFPLFRAPSPAHTMSKTHICLPFTLTHKKHTRHTKNSNFHFCCLSISCLFFSLESSFFFHTSHYMQKIFNFLPSLFFLYQFCLFLWLSGINFAYFDRESSKQSLIVI